MTRDEAKNYIVDHAADYLRPDRSKQGFICPCCGSGSGKSGTGITSRDGNKHFTCWAGCYTNADILEIIGIEHNITDFPGQLNKAAELFGITIESSFTKQGSTPAEHSREGQKQPKTEQVHNTELHNTNIHNEDLHNEKAHHDNTTTDYTQFFLQANKDIEKTSYHRELSLETLNKFKVGYVEKWKLPLEQYLNSGKTQDNGQPRTKESWEKLPYSSRLIIPTSKYSYIARATDKENRAKKMKVGKVHTFNIKSIKSATQPIFIVEGEIDALSIIEVGGEAVALGGINQVDTFLKQLPDNRPTQTLIVALDNEPKKQVEEAEKKLVDGIKALGLKCFVYKPYGEYKDANEALEKDRAAFEKAIAEAQEQEEAEANAESRAAISRVLRNGVAGLWPKFKTDIENAKTAEPIKTGFPLFDKSIGGGLLDYLYMIGAVTSLGKTTYALQIADHIAQSGGKVLLFSLEMGVNNIIARSISRTSWENTTETERKEIAEKGRASYDNKPFTETDITVASRYTNYSKEKLEYLESCEKYYRRYADNNIYIYTPDREGKYEFTAEDIRELVNEYISVTGITHPVVIIDYLQIVGTAEEYSRYTEKEKIDHTIKVFNRMKKELNIPIIVISSFGRSNYNNVTGEDSYKGSGEIEYNAECCITLEYIYIKSSQQGETKTNYQKAKQKNPREILLTLHKNRGNATEVQIKYDYYPAFNYFQEKGLPSELTSSNNNSWWNDEEQEEEQEQKVSKRDQNRQKLLSAYYDNEDTTRTATLGSLADSLDISKAEVKKQIKEYDLPLTLDGETVSLKETKLPEEEDDTLPF